MLMIFIGIFSFSIIIIIFQNFSFNQFQMQKITGYATTGTTVSNVTISKYLSIVMSGNLSAGILFGTVNAIPSTDINATNNNNSAELSSMFLNVSTDSNTAVDFCIKANTNLYDSTGGNTIGIGNETYSNASTTSSTIPVLSNQVLLTTSYIKAGQNITKENTTYYRFYLDIPTGTSSGTYNNTINFEGVETGQSC